MPLQALVIDQYALNVLSSAVIDNAWFKRFLLPQVSPHFQARPKVSEKAAFWRRSSSYRSISGRSLASGMLGMRS